MFLKKVSAKKSLTARFLMGRNENTSEYHMQTLDPEFHAYIKQKQRLSDRIHDHWKLELNSHVSNLFFLI